MTLEEAVAKLEESQASIEALKAKNKELLDEKKSTKTGAERQLADAQDKIEELSSMLDKTSRETKKTLDTLAKERDEALAKFGETSKAARDFERGIILRETLSKHGIGKRSADDVGDAIAHIERMTSYDETGKAIVKYKDADGKDQAIALSDYAEKVYPSTAHAKRFIPDGNSGAGAGGNGSTAGKPQLSTEAFNNLKPKEQSTFMKDGGVLTP